MKSVLSIHNKTCTEFAERDKSHCGRFMKYVQSVCEGWSYFDAAIGRPKSSRKATPVPLTSLSLSLGAAIASSLLAKDTPLVIAGRFLRFDPVRGRSPLYDADADMVLSLTTDGSSNL